MQRIAFSFDRDAERKTLIAPGRFAVEICRDFPQVCVSGFSITIQADAHNIVMGRLSYSRPLCRQVDQFTVDRAPGEISDHTVGYMADLRKQHLCLLPWRRSMRRRGDCAVSDFG